MKNPLRKILQFPELVCALALWTIVVPLNVVNLIASTNSLNFASIAFLLGGLASVIIGIYIGGLTSDSVVVRSEASHQSKSRNFTLAAQLGMLSLFGALIFYWRSSGSTADLDLANIRALWAEGVTGDFLGNIGYLLLVPLIYPATVLMFTSGGNFSGLFYLLAVLAGLGILLSLVHAGRSEVTAAIVMILACIVNFQPAWLLNRLKLVVLITPILIVSFVVLNFLFIELRTNARFNTRTAFYEEAGGSNILSSLGLNVNSEYFNRITFRLIGYAGTTFSFFDFFIKEKGYDVCYGLFQFRMLHRITVRVAGPDSMNPYQVKQAVDDMYQALDITNNVWATGFREVMLDTGVWLYFPALAGVGFLSRYLRNISYHNRGAAVLRIMILAWIIWLPLSNLMLTPAFEAGIYISILFAFADTQRSRSLAIKRRVDVAA